MEKPTFVRNPLTIIAMFAGIAELSAAAVLPWVNDSNQFLFMIFLWFFPTLIVILFFITLNLNHHVLYAPSDFRNEENYFKRIAKSSPAEREAKLIEEAQDLQRDTRLPNGKTEESPETSSAGKPQDSTQFSLVPSKSEALVRYKNAEILALKWLSAQYRGAFEREVAVTIHDGSRFIFDGLVRKDGTTTLVEIKYFRDSSILVPRLRDILLRLEPKFSAMPAQMKHGMSLLLVLVTDEPFSERGIESLRRFNETAFRFPVPYEVKLLSLSELEKL